MGQAGNLCDVSGSVEFFKAGMAVSMEPTFELLAVISRPHAGIRIDNEGGGGRAADDALTAAVKIACQTNN